MRKGVFLAHIEQGDFMALLQGLEHGARRLGGADDGAGAGTVVHDDGLIERLAQLFRERAGIDIGRPAGAERHDEADGAIGIVLLRLRGGCDGLTMVSPHNTPAMKSSYDVFAAARSNLMPTGAVALSGSDFALRPAMVNVRAMYEQGKKVAGAVFQKMRKAGKL